MINRRIEVIVEAPQLVNPAWGREVDLYYVGSSPPDPPDDIHLFRKYASGRYDDCIRDILFDNDGTVYSGCSVVMAPVSLRSLGTYIVCLSVI